MEYQKITDLLGITLDEIPRFITKKWVKVNDQSGGADDRYKSNKEIRYKNVCFLHFKNKQYTHW